LWEKLEGHLGGAKLVLLSPDGPLNYLPFAALPGAKPDQFLLHEYAFATVPVPQLLPELLAPRPDGPQQPSLLLVGDVDFGKTPDKPRKDGKLFPGLPVFHPLPGTAREVNELRTQFEETFPDALAPLRLLQQQATKEAVMSALPSYRYAHLATHGHLAKPAEEPASADVREVLFPRDPRLREVHAGQHPGRLSRLVFAGVNQPDRKAEETVLTALEAGELDLRAVELITLSACETGLGTVAKGEGVLGLQRAFQVAGSRSVAASLWKVPDDATQELMTRFYQNLWCQQLPKVDALRRPSWPS
jgi:CHAT domain-containing protein